MRISDWSSDVCSSDLGRIANRINLRQQFPLADAKFEACRVQRFIETKREILMRGQRLAFDIALIPSDETIGEGAADIYGNAFHGNRSEEHTSELQSLMRNSYAVFCLKKKLTYHTITVVHCT